ncbi:MAG: DUF4364 family protein [Clostridiaceae bacterium]|nr:DUF4364 family protein [Clostridiaceae bacterium]
MDQKTYSQASLIILAIVEMIPNATREEVIDSSIKSLYLDYFQAAETLDNLLANKLLHASINKGEMEITAMGKPVYRLNLTNEGHAVLKALKNTIPKPIFDFLAQLSQEKNKDKQLIAKYIMDSEQQFFVTLGQENKRETVISLSLTVPTEKMAREICEKWQAEADSIYQKIIQVLLAD